MPDSKITALTAITTVNPATFPLVIVDTSDTSMAITGTTKKVTTNQLLGSGGTATLASATITGDLTVDTSTLKVDSANNRVGVGTASPGCNLEVYSSSANELRVSTITAGDVRLGMSVIGTTYNWIDSLRSGGAMVFGVGNAEHYRITSGGTFTWSDGGGGTRMTLNSTGLGVGVTPASDKLLVSTTAGIIAASTTADFNFRNAAGTAIQRLRYTDTDGSLTIGSATGVAYPVNLGGDTTSRAVIIDASKNVGIGVTPSAWNSNYNALDIGQNGNISGRLGTSNTVDIVSNGFRNSAGNWVYKLATSNTACRYQLDGSTGGHIWYSGAAGTAGNTIAGFSTATMTLDASGNLLIGKTSSANSAAGVNIYKDATDGGRVYLTRQSGSASQTNVAFFESGGSAVGSITTTNTATSYNISSDYRLKEAVQPLVGGLARISALKPSIYKWKIDGSSSEGFLAHELAEAVPLAVTGEKDAVNEDGTIKPQQVDLSKVVPVLVAAIQELTARVQTIETR